MPKVPQILNLGDVQLPILDFAIQGTAILGIKESGKSYTGTYIAEQFIAHNIPWICFDQVGIWRWMRTTGDVAGGRGFPIVVAGGRSPDLELTTSNAATIVRMAMQANQNLVVDLFDPQVSKKDIRHIVRECCELLLHENPEHGLRHVFFEEAADLVPQRVFGAMASTYAAVEELCRKGGNSQLGYTLITTRPEDINKSVLELCDALLLHRQKGKNTLLGLRKWLAAVDPDIADRIGRSIGQLDTGHCWVWGRQSAEPELTRIPAKLSHHPDRRQQSGQTRDIPVGQTMQPGFLDFIRSVKATLTGQAQQVRKPILQPDAGHQDANPSPAGYSQQHVDEAERRGFEEGRRQGIEVGYHAGTSTVEGMLHGVIKTGNQLLEQLREMSAKIAQQAPTQLTVHTHQQTPGGKPMSPRTQAALGELATAAARAIRPVDPAGIRPAAPARTVPQDSPKPIEAAMRVLQVLARVHPLALTIKEWATRCGMSASGGTWNRYGRELERAGFIERDDHKVVVTARGMTAAGVSEDTGTQSRDQLLASWIRKLGPGPGRMLDQMARTWNVSYTLEQLAAEVNLAHTGGTFAGYVRVLERNGLIVKLDKRYFRVADIFRK